MMRFLRWLLALPLFGRALLRRREVETELDEELRFHIEQQTNLNIAAGQSPQEAKRQAMLRFGGMEQQKELCREVRVTAAIEQLGFDLRLGLRGLKRNRLFVVVALGLLTLGITASVTAFSVLDAVVLRPPSYSHPESLIVVEQNTGAPAGEPVPPFVYSNLRERRDLLEQVVATRRAMFTITDAAVPDQVFGLSVTANLFSLLPSKPLSGRLIQPDDEKPSSPPVVLLSFRAWRQQFGGDPDIVGKKTNIDGEVTTVVGVMREDFSVPGDNPAVWLPLRLTPGEIAKPNALWVHTIARLRPSVTLPAVQAALNALAAASEMRRAPGQARLRLHASRWQTAVSTTHRVLVWLGFGMVLALLLSNTANLASILLARGLSNQHDYAIRLATGASRARLVRQLFCEVLLIALAGLLLSLLSSAGILQLVRNAMSGNAMAVAGAARITIDGRIVMFSFAVSAAAALLSSIVPGFLTTSIQPLLGLRAGSARMTDGTRIRKILFGLVGVETCLSMALLLTSGLLMRSLIRLMHEDHGIKPDHVLTLRLPHGSWQATKVITPAEREVQIARYRRLLERVESMPSVRAAALSSSLPLSNVNVSIHFEDPSPGDHRANKTSPALISAKAVTRNYFRTVGIELLAGNLFPEIDASPASEQKAVQSAAQHRLAIVNEAFARHYFPHRNPIGQILRESDPQDTLEVIGVVRNASQVDLNKAVQPELYLEFHRLLTPFLTGMVVRSPLPAATLSRSLRTVLLAEDPAQPVVHIRTMQSLVDDNIALSRLSAWVFSGFALVSLSVAALGIYGVVAYIAASRKREFGIQLCLGSEPFHLFRKNILKSLVPVLLGLIAGTALAFAASRFIGAILYRTSPYDPLTAGLSALALVSVALTAAAIPLVRAVAVDPLQVLRSE